ncbi:centromere protein U [Bombina bombina]|uniref:centromere protein U n=1 Tax=Bombina bombina TaxID=8345 RepID=UPI00235A8F48|nr:centromere protein U [Bombina bombina]
MPQKKKPSKNNARKKVSKKAQNVAVQPESPAVEQPDDIIISGSKDRKRNSPLSEKMLMLPDLSSILKELDDQEQDDEPEEPFDPPLHSTAVYAEGDDALEKEACKEKSPQQLPRIPSARKFPGTSIPQSSISKNKNNESSTNSTTQKNTALETPKQTPQKVGSQETESKRSSVLAASAKKIDSKAISGRGSRSRTLFQEEAQSSLATENANKSKRKASKSEPSSQRKTPNNPRKRHKSHNMEFKASGSSEAIPLTIWSTENLPRSSRDLNELDIVLSEFEKIISEYKESVDSTVGSKAIETFFMSLKEEITTAIEMSQKLKNLKRKNTKMQLEIGKKRKHLIEVRDEIIENEPKLKQLQKEYSELLEKKSSLQKAREFLTNLQQLQGSYLKHKLENPESKETYGISSLPALLLQSETILRAEKHFYNINTKLQSTIDKRKGES